MKRYYGVDIEEQRDKLLKSTAAKNLIDEVIKVADEAVTSEYNALKISDYMLYIETGNRKTFEREYFRRRNNCSFLSMAYWLTENEKYKKSLVDLIFHICDEYTWCLPAHVYLENNPKPEFAIGAIDLFQAETARLMTDIAVMLGNKLPYYVNDRIEFEIRRRIIEPLMTRDFGWHHKDCTNNWAAVCAGGCTIAVMNFANDEERAKILPVLDSAMENFLRGFNNDGCCLEGYTYWRFGFGYYVLYAMAVLDYTEGRVNMLSGEKVKNIALFPQRVRMGQAKVVSFSDGGNDFVFNPGMFCLFRKLFGEEAVYPPLKLAVLRLNVTSVKELLWFDTEYKEDEQKFLTTFFDESEWYVKQTGEYSFAAKGGHNDEPHNHNDIGSFMIVAKDDSIPLTDLGCALYRKETFNPEYRYTFLNNGSQGHSVPVINGKYQESGKNFCAKNVKSGETFFEVDIEGAYEPGLVKRINRRFEFSNEDIVLCDSFEYSDKTEKIIDRFVSTTMPEIIGGCVDLKTAKIFFDKERYTVNVSEDSYRNHADTEDISVYLIDFTGTREKETEFLFNISIV